jgi:small subunit ribosomal protein S16
MLAIRMQRTGRKGHAQFRVIVQDSRRSPSSGNIVEQLGTYDPHTKVAVLNKERVNHFLVSGAQPSERIIRVLTVEKYKMPAWIEKLTDKKSKVKNPEKLRKNQPKVEKTKPEEVVSEPAVEEVTATEPSAETETQEVATVDETGEAETVETPVDATTPVEETKPEESEAEKV